ncbi:aminotransferase-like domain-containing protein [Paenibacillus alkalitolerans]|uniref:aminotransferase-like domain-containing protein n=1 Tax=Paenibacillus alkalitolerans TaxID=2799335 RepID=UPI001F488B11|nr:PLP-dependent aminotransferase family protein [Paenibacillus alkalitolerans]
MRQIDKGVRWPFADRVEGMKASEIREILKVTERPDMISFAGGLPDPELFPIGRIGEISRLVLERFGKEALQYSTTEGYAPLRRTIAGRMNRVFGTRAGESNILLTSGSQQGLDLTGKLFLDKGDTVVCESPTYLGAIQAFKAYEPRFVEVVTDDDGMDPEALRKALAREPNVKVIYVIPDFQNPTGRTWTLERRKQFMDVVRSSGTNAVIIEDNAYGELRFEGEILPSLASMDEEGRVVFLGTFSKTFCPGYRVGWIVADEALREKYVLAKQAADLHTSSINQREISLYLEHYDTDEHIAMLRSVYGKRRDAMVGAIAERFPEGIRHTTPQGGLFLWVELPAGVDAKKVLLDSVGQGVAFVPGGPFFPCGGHQNTMRLNYSNCSEERIAEGIAKLGSVIKLHMR